MKKKRDYLLLPWTPLTEKDVDFIAAYNNLDRKGLTGNKALPTETKGNDWRICACT